MGRRSSCHDRERGAFKKRVTTLTFLGARNLSEVPKKQRPDPPRQHTHAHRCPVSLRSSANRAPPTSWARRAPRRCCSHVSSSLQETREESTAPKKTIHHCQDVQQVGSTMGSTPLRGGDTCVSVYRVVSLPASRATTVGCRPVPSSASWREAPPLVRDPCPCVLHASEHPHYTAAAHTFILTAC